VFGIRGLVLGSPLSTGDLAGVTSTVGLRYFTADWVALSVEAGFSLSSQNHRTTSGLGLGAGVDLYGGTQGAPLRPYFAAEVSFSQRGSEDTSSAVVLLAAGGGLEYWLAPQFSVNAGLMLGLAAELENDAFAIGTFRPGIGVTLYSR
jgi:hypothetical protein